MATIVIAIALFSSSVAVASVQSGQLTAGDVDDNLNFESYLGFKRREQFQQFQLNPDLSGRVLVDVTDPQGQPFPCAIIELVSEQMEIPAGTNGLVPLFPKLDNFASSSLRLRARAPNGTCPQDCSDIVQGASNAITLQIPLVPALPSQLDIVLVVDTTGSMCDELAYLQAEMVDIVSNVKAKQSRSIDARVGLVLYRDRGDAYVKQVTDLGVASQFGPALTALREASCGGGGDYPEAMEEALEATAKLQWRPGLVARVAFLVADAPPHDQHLHRTFEAAIAMRKQGVKVYGLAASGVGDTAEFLMRLLAVVTGARHLWLTDDSGIGLAHQEPKVLCYRVTRLDQLLTRILDAELKGERVEALPTEIIREVGKQKKGVCLIDFQPTTTTTTAAPTADPTATPTAEPTAAPTAMPTAAAKASLGGDAEASSGRDVAATPGLVASVLGEPVSSVGGESSLARAFHASHFILSLVLLLIAFGPR